MNRKEQKNKEDFCPACIAVPLAFAGAGASSAGVNHSPEEKKKKKRLFWGGIIVSILSMLVAIYYIWIKKCKDCR